jgi:hypothetical protein
MRRFFVGEDVICTFRRLPSANFAKSEWQDPRLIDVLYSLAAAKNIEEMKEEAEQRVAKEKAAVASWNVRARKNEWAVGQALKILVFRKSLRNLPCGSNSLAS